MLATIITFGRLAKAGGSGCLYMVKTLAKFTKKKWKQTGNRPINQSLLDDEEGRDYYLQQELTYNKPSVLKRLYNNRPSPWQILKILARLPVGYALAVKEFAAMFLLVAVPLFAYLPEDATAERVSDALNIFLVCIVPVEAFANLFAGLRSSQHLALEFAEKWYGLFMFIWTTVPIWTSLLTQMLPAFVAALIITGLDMFEMLGTDLTQAKHHVLTGYLKKEEDQDYADRLTRREKVLRWVKGALLLPIRLLHIALPVLINVIILSGLCSMMIPDRWTNIKKLSHYPVYAFAALGFVLRIAAMRLANYKHGRQLKRNPIYYIYLGYKMLDAALYAAFQVFFIVTTQVGALERLLKSDALSIYYQEDVYLMSSLIAHQLLIGGLAAYQAGRDINKMFTEKIATYSVSTLTINEINNNTASHEERFMQSVNSSVATAKNIGFWKQTWNDFKTHISPEAKLVELGNSATKGAQIWPAH